MPLFAGGGNDGAGVGAPGAGGALGGGGGAPLAAEVVLAGGGGASSSLVRSMDLPVFCFLEGGASSVRSMEGLFL